MPSTTPSQSSSKPLQTSANGPLLPEQPSMPFAHTAVPGVQRPTDEPHGPPMSTSPPGPVSSILPSQSLSLPSHVSGSGTQPWHDKFSSTKPLQLSSLPLQISYFTVLATMSAKAASISDWLLARRAWVVPPETAIAFSSVTSRPAGSPMPST